MAHLDRIDTQLLALLQENGRISQHDLAKAVGLSAPAVAERLRKLEERGVIRQFTALLNAKLLGLDIAAFIFVGVSGSKYFDEFRSRVEATPQIAECHSITGQGSHLLKIRAENTAALERLLAQIQAWPGVQWTTTSIVLSTVKESTATPLPYGGSEAPSERDLDDEAIGSGDLIHVPFRHHL
jgi:Lrp/AsnC family transcriptional regulator, leucine-responsive regulatory protein